MYTKLTLISDTVFFEEMLFEFMRYVRFDTYLSCLTYPNKNLVLNFLANN